MNNFDCSKMLLPLLFLFSISWIVSSCKKDTGPQSASIAGTYLGVATVEEQVYLDGEMIYDTAFTINDQLIVTNVDPENKEFHFELISGFQTYYGQAPLNPTNYFLDENFTVWEGYDEFGYTYDNKKHWIFDPQADTAYFRLALFPYEPTLIDDPDSIGNYFELLHTWSYVLSAEKQ